MARDRLKVGVMLDSTTVDRWVYQVLADLAASDFVTLDCVILNGSRPRRSFFRSLRTFVSIALYTIYEAVDRRIFRREDDPLDAIDAAKLLEDVPRIEVLPVGKRWVQRFKREDLDAIRQRDLDVILRIGFKILRGKILTCARYGIWSYHHGDNREYRGGPPLFWEIYDGNRRSGCVLQILTEELDGGKVIYRCICETRTTSLHDNRRRVYTKGGPLVMRRLRDLHNRGFEFLTSLETYNETLDHDPGIQHAPTNAEMLTYFRRIAWRIVRNRFWVWAYDDLWFVAVQFRGGQSEKLAASSESADSNEPWIRIDAPRGRFYADPFPIDVDDGTWLFFEDCGLNRFDGVISCVWCAADGTIGEPRVALSVDCHLSYPFVFEWRGSYYMIPETGGNRTVELYRASEFPYRWERERVLLQDVDAVDSTLFEHEGRFWLFVAMTASGGPDKDELFLFHSDSPLGEWVAHPLNPVVSDVQRARPAGRIQSTDNGLIRPGQDCSLEYGWAVTLSRIETLTPDDYHEVPVGRIEPDWIPGIRLTHTANETARLRVRDARARQFRWGAGARGRRGLAAARSPE